MNHIDGAKRSRRSCWRSCRLCWRSHRPRIVTLLVVLLHSEGVASGEVLKFYSGRLAMCIRAWHRVHAVWWRCRLDYGVAVFDLAQHSARSIRPRCRASWHSTSRVGRTGWHIIIVGGDLHRLRRFQYWWHSGTSTPRGVQFAITRGILATQVTRLKHGKKSSTTGR